MCYSICKEKVPSLRGQACWAEMTSPGGKLTMLACHPTKKVNKGVANLSLSLQTLIIIGCLCDKVPSPIVSKFSTTLHFLSKLPYGRLDCIINKL